ncbi:MAG: major capsid protein [Dermatophilaceae bacterium]
MLRSRHPFESRLVRLATAYDDATPTPAGDDETVTFTLPEDLSELSDAELDALRSEAVDAFDSLYSVEEPSAEDVEAMSALADATDAIRQEQDNRAEATAANREAAEALASRVRPDAEGDADADEADDAETTAEAVDEVDADAPIEGDTTVADAEAVSEPEPVTASAKPKRSGPLSVTVPAMRRRQPVAAPQDESKPAGSLVASADLGNGLSTGQPIRIADAARALTRKAQGINESAYRSAFRTGNRLTNSFGVLSVERQFPDELTASGEDATEVMGRAANEKRLEGGSLVASGGWCSPSETLYDLFEIESSDGLLSAPEIGISRGGIRHTVGPDFASLFGDTGFTFTETQDEAGEYAPGATDEDPLVEGEKPCFKVECPGFTEDRLNVTGLCITAGILQNRAYPEITERTIRGALVGHQHRVAGQKIAAMVAASDAVTMPADQVGALAPILTAVELQVEHYRYVHRMARSATLEAIFPYWVRGVIRSDLSRRLGVPLENVTDTVIGQHFAERGIAPQFVYNYQDITGAADAFTSWQTDVEFMLYAAGTFVVGSSDLITLEAVFDSALFKVNDFTALFTEEGWLVAKRGHDSRVVTVPICPSGATAGGVLIDCDGSEAPAT